MWFLHVIPKNSSNSTVYSRLRPAQVYQLRCSRDRSTNTESVFIEVEVFTCEQVTNVRTRPTVHLKAGDIPVKVDNQVVDLDDIELLDQQLIRLNNGDVQYKLQWEEVGVYHIKSHNRAAHEQLIEQGCKYGFHVVKELGVKTTTHYYFPEDTPVEPTKYLTFALLQNLIFITDYWLIGLDTMDKKFSIREYNEKTEPLCIENQGPLRKTAILGRDTRRSTLFRGLEFWFFDDDQYREFSMYIKMAGGQSRRATFKEGQEATICASTLFVEPPREIEAFLPLRAKFHLEAEVERCLLDWEIVASVLYCSTNYTCNPRADIITQMSPDDPYYTSLPTSMKSIPVKQESLSQDIQNILPDDEKDTQPIDERNTVPIGEHDTVFIRQDEDENMDEKIEHERPSSAIATSLQADESVREYYATISTVATSLHGTYNNEEMEPVVKSEPIERKDTTDVFDFESHAMINDEQEYKEEDHNEGQGANSTLSTIPDVPMNVNDFFDDMFGSQKQMIEENRLLQERRKQEETQRIYRQQQEKDEEECQRIYKQQQQKEKEKTQAYQEQLAVMQQNVMDEYVHEIERRRKGMEEEEEEQEDEEEEEDNQPIRIEEQVGEFLKVQYAKLIVKPKPTSPPQQTSVGGVNFKKFKKVHQFQPDSVINTVCLITNNQPVQSNNPHFISGIQHSSQYDPDVAIVATRRRRL